MKMTQTRNQVKFYCQSLHIKRKNYDYELSVSYFARILINNDIEFSKLLLNRKSILRNKTYDVNFKIIAFFKIKISFIN